MLEETRVCDYCGEVLEEEYEIFEGENGSYCCEGCREDAEPDYVCEYCNEWDPTTTYVGDLNMQMCDTCYGENVITCDNCGAEILWENRYVGENGSYCCEECMDEAEYGHSAYVFSYGYKPTPIFFTAPEEAQTIIDDTTENKRYYFGIENELDADYPDKSVERELGINYHNIIYLKTDGSLNDGGIEIVSHPGTFAYHLNYAGWDKILKTATNGVQADSGCGMHVHVGLDEFSDVTRTQANLVRFFNYFWDEMVDNSGREYTDDLDQWASRPYLENENYNLSDTSIVNSCQSNGRYQAVNLTNRNTVEIRIFQGVNYAKDLYENLALVNRIVYVCDTKEWKEISGMDFYKDIYKPAMDSIKHLQVNAA